MSQYIVVETPGGKIVAEVDAKADSGGISLVGIREKLPSFEDAAASLKKNAKYLLDLMTELGPDEVEIECGLKAGVEGGNSFWGLAKVSGEASYTVKLKWKAEED